jgi:hypothetical protein
VTTLAPLLFGPLRDHPAALPFAREVVRVHRRYATEVVAARRLCPFVRDVDVAFGQFCVALSVRADLEEARAAFMRAENAVVHVVYPLVSGPAPDFERFGADLGRAARDVWRAIPPGDVRFGPEPPVIATFHPLLPGERTAPHRLIGLLRRSPDPFVQIIPGGHHEGGTTVASLSNVDKLSPQALAKILAAMPVPQKDRIHDTFARLSAAQLDDIAKTVADIRADRDRSYAPFLKELGVA